MAKTNTRNPHKVTAVLKYGEQQTKKVKKARPIEGRNVQDAYFSKTIEKTEKPPLQAVWERLTSGLPEDFRRNVENTWRSLRKMISPPAQSGDPS